ncbi:MAG TPA: A/G-specific adenine glycosylase [Rhizobiales bacterium]|nr:A/G-specific adenine glycosylase [Hyphomicrobiales bacterium]
MATVNPENFSDLLLDWYDRHRRALVWRALPGEVSDPYRVWLSEIMLQQTTVQTVAGYFEKFLARWPDVSALADTGQGEVLAAWAGLGYYARARNLHACAQIVAGEMNSVFPSSARELAALPGIGPYTSAAIAAIAFGEPVAAVDGNVERVISRVFAITTPLPAAKAEIRAKAQQLVPHERPGDFAQGLMDLGAMVCTSKKPGCAVCPLAGLCMANDMGIAETLPARLAKKARPVRYGTAFVVQREDGCVLLRKRPAKGLLAAMDEVPSTDWLAANPPPRTSRKIEHTFTHFHLVLGVEVMTTPPAGIRGNWVHPRDFGKKALPTVMKKVLAAAGCISSPPSRP